MSYSFVAGNVLTAAQLNALSPVYVIKQAGQANATTTLANDSELLVVLAAGKTYRITLDLVFGGSVNTADIKTAWTTSGTLSHLGSRTCRGPSVSTTDQGASAAAATTVGVLRSSGGHGLGTAVSYGSDGAANTSAVEERAIISGGASGGTLTLQWAANGVGTTTVIAGSYLIAEVIAA